MTTLDDVARASGVSAKTVSRVVNGEPGVSAVTTLRVEEAIRTLGYRRNDAARNLRRGVSLPSIGLLIEDLANPFYASVAGAVEQVALRHGRAVVLTSSGEDPARERELLAGLIDRGVEGLLVVPAGHDHRYLPRLLRPGLPAVFIDRAPGGIAADVVVLDNLEGARRATHHLIAHGHRRIAFIGDALSVSTSSERLEGFRLAHAQAGLPLDPGLVRLSPPGSDTSIASMRAVLSLDEPATAVLAQNNRNCLGVLRALAADGARCAIVGFDDFELADLVRVPVTVVAYDPGEMGRAAAELLFARLAGDLRPPQRIVVPTRLIARGSGEIPPGA
jgi:LacI family transcriptional regulator